MEKTSKCIITMAFPFPIEAHDLQAESFMLLVTTTTNDIGGEVFMKSKL